MGIMNFFTRSAIRCNDKELRETINDWTKEQGWVFEDFAKFLELVGIKTPVQIERIESENEVFKCVSEDGKEYQITLKFGDSFKYNSKIYVTVGSKKIGYICSERLDNYCPKPKVTKQTTIIKENNKSLDSYYGEIFYLSILKLNECRRLIVTLYGKLKTCEKLNMRIIQNATKIEEYLFNLDTKLVVSEVYDKIVSILKLSHDDLKEIITISISFEEKEVGKEERILACIRLLHGEMQEYAILDGDQTFHVFKDRSWQYSSSDTRILYRSDCNSYVFVASVKEKLIAHTIPVKLLNSIEERISQLWKFIE